MIQAYKVLAFDDKGMLRSVFTNHTWPDNEQIEAQPKITDTRGGIESFKEAEFILSQFKENRPHLVLVTLNLWGMVHEHEQGYRSEYVSLHSIHLSSGSENLNLHLSHLRRNYPHMQVFVDDKRIEMPSVIDGGLGRTFL